MHFIRWFILSVCCIHSPIFCCARPSRGYTQCIIHYINMLCIYNSYAAEHIPLWGTTRMDINMIGPVWSRTKGNSAELVCMCSTAPHQSSVPASALLPWGYLLQYPTVPHKIGGNTYLGIHLNVTVQRSKLETVFLDILYHNWHNCNTSHPNADS